MSRIKLVSTNRSNYFETNKIEKGTTAPTTGTYNKGDIVINIGADADTIPMWIYSSAGKWIPVNTGNTYTHPASHPASMITQDTTHRFITDAEKAKLHSVGDKSSLQTSNKNDLVSAINEIKGRADEAFQNANNGKKIIAAAIGSPVFPNDTFNAMGTKIDNLTQKFKETLNEKGVTVNSEDNISSLINKTDTLQLGKKTASGNTVVSASKISVRGLNFKPRFIHGWQTGHNAGDKRNIVYCSSPQIDICSEYSNYFQGYGRSIIYDDGFDLWVGNAESGTTINWQVYE